MGRGSWGIEMAARSYFGKSAKDLTLAGSAPCWRACSRVRAITIPTAIPHRAEERLTYVLDRMKDDGFITAEQKDQALAAPPKLVAFTRLHRDSGFEFVDYLGHEAKTDGVDSLTAAPYTVRSTINAAAAAPDRSRTAGGVGEIRNIHGPHAVSRAGSQHRGRPCRSSRPPTERASKPACRPGSRRCSPSHLPLYDVHWTPAVVVDKGGGKKGNGAIRVGLPDGRIVPLTTYT